MFGWFNKRNKPKPRSKKPGTKSTTIEQLMKIIEEKDRQIASGTKLIGQIDQKWEKAFEKFQEEVISVSSNAFHSFVNSPQQQPLRRHETLNSLGNINNTYDITNDESSLATDLAQRVDEMIDNNAILNPPPSPNSFYGSRTPNLTVNQLLIEPNRDNQLLPVFSCNQRNSSPIISIPNSSTGPFSDSKTIDRLNAAKLNHAMKSLPKYEGKFNENISNWFYAMERFFKKYQVPEHDQVCFASDYLDGNASESFKAIEQTAETMSWPSFKSVMTGWFQPQDYQDILRRKLVSLKQKDKVHDYIHEFDSINNHVRDMLEADKINYFISGLKPLIAGFVKHSKCSTLIQAKLEAIRVECNFGAELNQFGAKPNEFKHRNDSNKRHEVKNNEKQQSQSTNRDEKKCFRCQAPYHPGKGCSEVKKEHKANLAKQNNNNTDKKYNNNNNNQNSLDKSNKQEKESKPKTLAIPSSHNIYNSIVLNSLNKLLRVKGYIKNIELDCILDTGATTSIISTSLIDKFGWETNKTSTKVSLANGEEIDAQFTKPLPLIIQGRYCELSFIILPNQTVDLIIGLDWFNHHQVSIDPANNTLQFPRTTVSLNTEEEEDNYIYLSAIQDIAEEALQKDMDWDFSNQQVVNHEFEFETGNDLQQTKIKELLSKYNHCFANNYNELGSCKLKKIVIKTSASSPIFQYPYRKSMKERQAIKEEVNKMLEANIIRPSKSPWSSPVVMIPKKDGTKRFCVDYRKLNQLTIQDGFPLPRIDDILDRLSGSRWFSTIDLKSGYWQLTIEEESIPITAFSTPDGHYEFTRLPFGLKNAPAEFSRLMQQVLGDLPFVEIYLDDITIHSKEFNEHIEHIKIVFERLIEADLRVNPAKCVFLQESVLLLGHVVSAKGITLNPAKIEAIKNMRYCKNVKQVQEFLGLCGYYRKFVKDFAKIAQPLNNLIKKDTKWDFNKDCMTAFETLREKLVSSPILRLPDLSKPFLLFTDASGFALGAILSQKDEKGDEYVVAYASRTLKGAEEHYGISEKECLAVIWAIKQFRIYLYGTKFDVITDHQALYWLMTIKDPTGKLARWSIYLQAYEFNIIHRRGRVHSNVDTLSRPVLFSSVAFNSSNVTKDIGEEDSKEKTLDIWEDEYALYYLQYGRHKQGSSNNQKKRVDKIASHYSFTNGHVFYSKEPDTDETLFLVPKPQEREQIITKAHLLGHFQMRSTLQRIKEKYFWKNMAQDIQEVIDKCLTCVRHQKVQTKRQPAIALQVDGIFDRIGMDIVLGLPKTQRGFKGVLVITEYLSKYPYAVPIKQKSAEEVAKHLLTYISIFGPPKIILTDQGTEFVNETVDKLIQGAGVEHRITSPYHPQTNGLTERFNGTFISSLKKHAENEPHKWDLWIPYVLLAYRTRVHSTTNFTPYELLFGRSMNTFEDFETNDIKAIENRCLEIKNLIENKQVDAIETIKEKQEIQKRNQDSRPGVTTRRFNIGTQVAIK